MPVKIKKVDGYRVSTPGGVKAKSTTKKKAQRQANLLRAVDRGWKPTGAPARDVKSNPGPLQQAAQARQRKSTVRTSQAKSKNVYDHIKSM